MTLLYLISTAFLLAAAFVFGSYALLHHCMSEWQDE
jgi:hypothetical protein